MAEGIALAEGSLRATIRPGQGGAVGRFDLVRGDRREPVFRPETGDGETAPFRLASNVLVPWSNRVSGGGFSFRGRRYELAPNLAGEPFPIHGNGFSSVWDVVERDGRSVRLRLESEGPGPYRYLALLTYALGEGALSMALEVTNRADAPLPYGLGFHPWLVREADTTLFAPARQVWLEDGRHLPAGSAPVAIPPEWDFSTPKPLPSGFINNGFVGWSGTARVAWPGRRLRLEITASPNLSTAIIYSPGADADFFCFEPVSHPVDAFNLPGGPEANGLVVLEPGEKTSASARFTVSETKT